jgi:hypothetical protein
MIDNDIFNKKAKQTLKSAKKRPNYRPIPVNPPTEWQ